MVGESVHADGTAIRYLDTASAYDLWAQHYDTDGNFLTALDDKQMVTLLPRFLSMVTDQHQQQRQQKQKTTSSEKAWRIVDLGCGTGRNTIRLVEGLSADTDMDTEVVALDLSPEMLAIARDRILHSHGKASSVSSRRRQGGSGSSSSSSSSSSSTVAVARNPVQVTFDVYDMLASPSPSPPPTAALGATAVLSTLVLEHVPLPVFFQTVSAMLAPGGSGSGSGGGGGGGGGLLLLTNMHSNLGQKTQAGFVEPQTGERIRPTSSYAHTEEDVLTEAARQGFEVVVPFEERVLTEEDLIGGGGGGGDGATMLRGAKYVGVKVWFGGILRKRS